MSADEFDPFVERLFAQSRPMPDAELFVADVETRLASGTRVRTLALTIAGLVGGLIAVRETLTVRLNFNEVGQPAVMRSFDAASTAAQAGVQGGLDRLGLGSMDLGAFGGMQLFWIAAGSLAVLLAAGAVRLSQEG